MVLLKHILFVVVLSVIVMSTFSSVIDYETLNNCTCLPYHLCKDDVADNIADGLVDVRILKPHSCENYYELCCEHPTDEIKYDQAKSNKNTDESLKKCGYGGNSDRYDYHITGKESNHAEFAEFPWSVIVLLKQPVSNRLFYKCGGSLIHPQVVLTATHCLNDDSEGDWTVRAGEWNAINEEEPLPDQDKEVKEIAIHPHYHHLSLKNDIALLILSDPFQLADNVRTVCLPKSNNLQVDHVKCVATGWGTKTFKEQIYSHVMKKVEVPIIPRQQCQSSLRNTRLGKFFKLHRSFICAGGEMDQDTCIGDGGNPLVCPIPEQRGRHFQVGIVAWGIGCGMSNTPSAYVNVALFVNWIDNQLKAKGFDSSYYEYVYTK